MPRDPRRFTPVRCRPIAGALARAVLALAVWFVCSVATASTPPAAVATELDTPRFLLETLEVAGAERVTEEIVLAESLLVPGRAYREEELRDAVFRLRRLPFVLAGFAGVFWIVGLFAQFMYEANSKAGKDSRDRKSL